MSQAALADILAGPPLPNPKDEFAGRDWKEIKAGELVSGQAVPMVDLDAPVTKATEILIGSGTSAILIRSPDDDGSACGTFDYRDLNAFLLLVIGLHRPEPDSSDEPNSSLTSFHNVSELAQAAREGKNVAVRDVMDLGKKDPFVTLSADDNLAKVVEVLGGSVHMIAIAKEGTKEIIGTLSQLRILRFFWENGRSFSNIEKLYHEDLKDLRIGSSRVISINGDKKLSDALSLMNDEGVSSLAVVDNNNNVVGNISTVDVKLLTSSSSLPLLRQSCIHFLSVILGERGIHDGKDSFPVFHINTLSTLSHTVSKLLATRSHRMWVVEAPSPATSAPPTPTIQPALAVPPPSMTNTFPQSPGGYISSMTTAMSAASMPGARLSGRLTGVVSLTDILNLFARSSGLSPEDPNEVRRHRRRSSSSSMRVSMESGRSSSMDPRESSSARGSSMDVRRQG